MSAPTSTSNYTHIVCFDCGRVLYCSEAEEWDATGYGWCPHFDDSAMPESVLTRVPSASSWHHCAPSDPQPER